jgi:hypothetical protein
LLKVGVSRNIGTGGTLMVLGRVGIVGLKGQ